MNAIAAGALLLFFSSMKIDFNVERSNGCEIGSIEFLERVPTADIFTNLSHTINLHNDDIGLVSFVVFSECRHGYVVSSLMDTAYWSSE
ncbi:hypothetical protein Tco_1042441 [Tanacetum coccineum]|uniref:Uncharacterized protein n=1 Tax=Tanacetum coccineum TaxID=301880 RepID=A0ABQ5GKH3_9ASTR